MNILIYSRKGIFDWASDFKKYLLENNITAEIITELTFDGDIKLGKQFNNNLNSSSLYNDIFSIEEIDDIIARCRLLRSIDINKARKMVITYSSILDEIFLSKEITHFISIRVDNYFLDIIYRLSKVRNFKFVGLWKNAILKNKLFFTSKGDNIYIQESTSELLSNFKESILSETFKATSLNKVGTPNILSVFKFYVTAYLRAIVLFLLKFYHNDHNGYRYLTTPLYVDDYKLNFKNNFSHLLYTKNWDDALTNIAIKNKLFIGLQVNPEATIDYYASDIALINVNNVISKILEVSKKNNISIFIKDHPNMLGKRNYNFLKKLQNLKDVYLIPSYIDSNYIIKHTDATFTWSGTIGIQAAVRGKCSIIVDAPYYVKDLYYKINNFEDISLIPSYVLNHKSKDFNFINIAKQVTDTLFDGDLIFKNRNYEKRKNTFFNIMKFIDA